MREQQLLPILVVNLHRPFLQDFVKMSCLRIVGKFIFFLMLFYLACQAKGAKIWELKLSHLDQSNLPMEPCPIEYHINLS